MWRFAFLCVRTLSSIFRDSKKYKCVALRILLLRENAWMSIIFELDHPHTVKCKYVDSAELSCVILDALLISLFTAHSIAHCALTEMDAMRVLTLMQASVSSLFLCNFSQSMLMDSAGSSDLTVE